MTDRRQKNIADAVRDLDTALDTRDVLLAKLVRLELKIQKLKKRRARAEKAYVAKGCASVAAGVAPSPYRGEREIAGEFDDAIPI